MSAIFRIDPLFLDNWLYYKKREDIKQSTQHLLSTPAIQQKKKHNFIFFLILAPNYSLPWISLFTWNRAVPHFLFVWRTVSLMIKPISVSPWCMFELAAIGGRAVLCAKSWFVFCPISQQCPTELLHTGIWTNQFSPNIKIWHLLLWHVLAKGYKLCSNGDW